MRGYNYYIPIDLRLASLINISSNGNNDNFVLIFRCLATSRNGTSTTGHFTSAHLETDVVVNVLVLVQDGNRKGFFERLPHIHI